MILSAQWSTQLAVAFPLAARRFVVKLFFYLNPQLFLLRPFSERSLSGSMVSRQPTVSGVSKSRSLECSSSPTLHLRRSRLPEPELSTLSSTSHRALDKYLLHSAPCSGVRFWVLKQPCCWLWQCKDMMLSEHNRVHPVKCKIYKFTN